MGDATKTTGQLLIENLAATQAMAVVLDKLEAMAQDLERERQMRRQLEFDMRQQLERIEIKTPPALLTISQTAKLLHKSAVTIRSMLDRGLLKEVRVGRKTRLVDVTSIQGVKHTEIIEELRSKWLSAA